MNYSTKLNLSILLDFYGDILSDRQKEIANLYYNEDLSLREISEISGITFQGVRDSLKKTENILTNMEEKLSLNKKFVESRKVLGEIISGLEKISDENPDLSESIGQLIEKAKQITE